MANRWLFKTDPDTYPFQRLIKDRRTVWDGVKNNLALKHLARIRKGDAIIIYHTGSEKALVGTTRSLSGAYLDPAKKDPKLLVFDIKAIESLPRAVPLVDLKADAGLVGFDLIRLPRLSVMEVNEKQWRIIMRRAGK